MKRSELKEYIRETIINELTPQDAAANTAAKLAIDDTVKDLTTKASQTTDAENKKAALASLTAAKTKQAQINKAIQSKQSVPVDMLPENEDSFIELTDKDVVVDPNDPFAKLKSQHEGVVKLMKSIANKWKMADGFEKDKYFAQLKDLTKVKKELEALMNPSMEDDDEEF
jgi:hypothetical protein